MDTRVTTFHGRVYGNKVLRKTSDLPDDLTNASAATRRVFEPAAQQSKQPAKDKSKRPKKVVHKRISSSGDELQNQVDSGWVNVNLSLMAVTDLLQLAKKLTKGVDGLRTLKLECFPKEYDRLEADAVKLHCKPKYALASTDHETLVKSTVDLVSNPKLKGKVPSAIKEVLAHGTALEELTIGMSLPAAVWKALCSSLGAHQSLQTLSLAGSAIGDATLQVLSDGLRANQTIAELNLCGCKISDEGVKVLAGIIKANAAEADVQEWHEGLREYPDLSLAPHLRRQQFRARSREIRGRVQARCGGLHLLHLAENKISDAGADVLLDALVMDRSMVLLDLSANQLTMKSGKRLSKLMRKHKGLLRVDLRSNAEGLSGVLHMMPKGSAHSALKPDPSQVSDHASLALPGRAADPEGDAESRMPDQALSAAAAAMEAAKLNVWKAEVMCEIEGFKSSLEAQAVERQRAEARVAELQNENLKLTSRPPLPADPPKPALARKKPTASGKKSNRLAKKATASKQKLKPKGAAAVLLQDDLSGEVLRGQQQVMGDLSQVIRSLDELVSDIEETQAHPIDDHSHMCKAFHGGICQLMSLRTCQPVARPWSCKAAFTSPSSSCVHCPRAPVLLRRSSNTRERFTSNGRRWSAALENNAQVDVSVPLETAWDLWRDKTQIIKWMPWINRIEIVPDDPKQSKWVLCTNQFGRNWELSWRALDLTPIRHQKIHWRSLPGSNSSGIEVPNRGQVRFYKKGPNACTVKLTITYEVPGPLTPFASAITPLVERILQTDMNRFRTYATSQQQ
ncbi:hypothetical protein WJX79_001133 [Trebouxia sp. C0005]